MDELVIDNLVYIPSKKAAQITGYAKDYVGQLCREGRIEAKLVGRSWYVLESSVREHRFGKTHNESVATTASESNKSPQTGELDSPEEIQKEETLHTWEPASYTPETVEEIVHSNHPTYLTNTTQENTLPVSQIEEVQNAWQEWFSKNELHSTKEPLVAEESHPVQIEEREDRQEEIEDEQTIPEEPLVRITRSYVQGSMDIQTEQNKKEVLEYAGVVLKERVVKKKRPERKKGGALALRAVFLAIIIITVAVTIIGSGSLDSISPTWVSKSGVIDYIAGVRSVAK